MVRPRVPGQQQLPIQAVDNPIICSPYEEPTEHWIYDPQTGDAQRIQGRRQAGYWYRTGPAGDTRQLHFTGAGFAQEEWEPLQVVNMLRDDVKRWRERNYEGATNITRRLLRHWWRADRPRRLFFCQLEAVETVIYLNEILEAGRRPRWNTKLTLDDFRRLSRGEKPSFLAGFSPKVLPTLIDKPNEPGLPPLRRYGCKMATGSGKTIVMAMLIAWALCNRGRVPGDNRFPRAVLVCCPNLTVKERLRILQPDHKDNYYAAFDLVPTDLRPLLQQGRVFVTNWHVFAPESEHVEDGKSYAVVNKGPETPEAFARRVLGELYNFAPLMVLNDEGHHAYRPAPLRERLEGEEGRAVQADREEATVWISGLDRINVACGIRFCVDLSATPFYIAGSGYEEGQPFPWLVSDFGLVDAIESGIVKIPRLPVSDDTGRPEPRYFRLWQTIVSEMQPGEFLPGRSRKPKPDRIWLHAQPALTLLASQWKERFDYIQQSTDSKDKIPPVLIIVCDNTDIAEVFYRNISGEVPIPGSEADETDDDEESSRSRRRPRNRISYGHGQLFPEYFQNTPDRRYTVRIDTKLLAEAESDRPDGSRQEAAQELRRIVATVGRRGEPGEHIRCVVSVGMLTEGWDANNVTHIFGVRAFGSQLLCEQVVGRGLRRMDYEPDPQTGRLSEEYVDVYGIPFTVIPFKGRKTSAPAPEDKPITHVRALPERSAYKIEFPVVEGYAFALRRNVIKAEVDKIDPLDVTEEPTAVFVRATVGYQVGVPSALGPGRFVEQNREEFYRSTHLQKIEFEVAAEIVNILMSTAAEANGQRTRFGLQSRHQLFPQVLRIVKEYVQKRVNFRGCNPCELGHRTYFERLVERLVDAIEPDDTQGEPPLLPILNRYKPIGTTAEVDFKTTRRCHGTERSHISHVVVDTRAWEASVAFRLEQARDIVAYYARNDGLGFVIPYEYGGVSHSYEPDFLVRLTDGTTLILEVKGYLDDQDQAKHTAARRWVRAVNNWGKLGRWEFHVCRDPQMLGRELSYLIRRAVPS